MAEELTYPQEIVRYRALTTKLGRRYEEENQACKEYRAAVRKTLRERLGEPPRPAPKWVPPTAGSI